MFNLALSSKIHAALSQLLTAKEYHSLIEQNDLKGFYKTLSGFPRYRRLPNLEEQEVTRIRIEDIIYENRITEYLRFVNFSFSGTKSFLIELSRKFELDNVKLVIRQKLQGKEISKDQIANLQHLALLDAAKLVEARSVEELAETLKHTSFYRPMTEAIPLYKETKNALILESVLDYQHWKNVVTKARALSLMDILAVGQHLEIETSAFNVSWIYRGKFLLGLQNEQITPHLLSTNRNEEKKFYDSLISAQTVNAFFDFIKNSKYKEILPNTAEAELRPGEFHLALQKYLLKRTRDMKALFPFSVSRAIVLWKCIEFETQNLSTICESIYYKKNKDEIFKYLLV